MEISSGSNKHEFQDISYDNFTVPYTPRSALMNEISPQISLLNDVFRVHSFVFVYLVNAVGETHTAEHCVATVCS